MTELGEALRSGRVTAVELAELAIERLTGVGRRLNAVVIVTAETALAQAARADAEMAAGVDRGPLHGIPYGARDLLAARGYSTTGGAAPFRGQRFDADAAVVQRMAAGGAVLVGKLAMVEMDGGFGYKQSNAAFTGPGRNAGDPERWAGGSSSGSGSAVGAGCVRLAIGSESWGSIVTLATYNGVTGLRLTYGLVSRNGAMAPSWSMDKIGPLAHTARDCELAMTTLAGPDPADESTLGRSRYRPDARRSGFRFATLAGAEDGVEPEIAARYHEAVAVFRELGTVAEITLPDLPADAAAETVIAVEAASVFLGAPISEEPKDPAIRTIGGTANLCGLPGLCLPAGPGRDGLPTAVVLAGPADGDAALLAAGIAFQSLTGWHRLRPPQEAVTAESTPVSV